MSNELREVSNRSGIQEVHDGKVAASRHTAVESFQLLFRGGAVGPQPVLHVHAPVDDVWVGDVSGELLPQARADGSIWGSKVRGCSVHQTYVEHESGVDLHSMPSWPLKTCFDWMISSSIWARVGNASILHEQSACPRPSDKLGGLHSLWMRIGMQSNLMSLGQHLPVEIAGIGRGIAQSSPDNKECYPNILLVQNSHDLLRKSRLSVVNAESKGIRSGTPKKQCTTGQLVRDPEVVVLWRGRGNCWHNLDTMQCNRLVGVEPREGYRDHPILVNLKMRQGNEELTLARDGGVKVIIVFILIFIVTFIIVTVTAIMKPLYLGMLLLSTSSRCSVMIIHDCPISSRNARPGLHHISRCLDTVWYTRERTPARITFSIMLVQRDTELIRALEHHMQELILPRK